MSISQSTRFRVFTRDRFACVYCGRAAPHVVLEADHKMPRSKGGVDDEANLVTSCKDCNRGKRDRVLPAEAKSEKAKPHGDTRGTDKMPAHPLINRYAHTFSPCVRCGKPRVQYQVQVVALIADGIFLVQLFEWLMGEATDQRMYTADEMREGGWQFYDTAEAWRHAYEHRREPQHRACDEIEYAEWKRTPLEVQTP